MVELVVASVATNAPGAADPDTWSPLEYCAHLRDVLFTQRERLLPALVMVTPTPTSMYADARAMDEGYAEQRPEDALRQLADAAALFANVVARLGADAGRTLVYNHPAPQVRSLGVGGGPPAA